MIVSKGDLFKWCQIAFRYIQTALLYVKEGLKNFVFVEVIEDSDAKQPDKPKAPRRKKDKKLKEAASEKPIIINNLQEIQDELAQNKPGADR